MHDQFNQLMINGVMVVFGLCVLINVIRVFQFEIEDAFDKAVATVRKLLRQCNRFPTSLEAQAQLPYLGTSYVVHTFVEPFEVLDRSLHQVVLLQLNLRLFQHLEWLN